MLPLLKSTKLRIREMPRYTMAYATGCTKVSFLFHLRVSYRAGNRKCGRWRYDNWEERGTGGEIPNPGTITFYGNNFSVDQLLTSPEGRGGKKILSLGPGFSQRACRKKVRKRQYRKNRNSFHFYQFLQNFLKFYCFYAQGCQSFDILLIRSLLNSSFQGEHPLYVLLREKEPCCRS